MVRTMTTPCENCRPKGTTKEQLNGGLRRAAVEDHETCLNAIIAAGADVNAIVYGQPVFVQAARYDCKRSLHTLIEAGANVNLADSSDSTALGAAAGQNGYECVELLLKAGADVNVIQFNGSTPLIFAAYKGYDKCVKMLIQSGADVNIADQSSHAALTFAAREGHTKCVRLLTEAGADVNVKTDSGYTPLTLATKMGKHRCVEQLIQAEADVNKAGMNGMTALFETTDSFCSYNVHCLQMLLRAGAHVNKTNEMGQNALMFCIEKAKYPNSTVIMLLFAAGETINEGVVYKFSKQDKKMDPYKAVFHGVIQSDLGLCLKHMCRDTIRRHLIKFNPHLNLFLRVPQLGLPASLESYLLYNTSLTPSNLPTDYSYLQSLSSTQSSSYYQPY